MPHASCLMPHASCGVWGREEKGGGMMKEIYFETYGLTAVKERVLK